MPILRILGVCGVVSTTDAWLFEDMTLLHDILPAGDEGLWLSAIPSTKFGSALQKYGHPRARRVILPSARNVSFSWLTTVGARKLKKHFMSALRHMVEFTKTNEMLIVSINGHGSSRYGFEGAVQVGRLFIGNPRFLQCQEVLSVIKGCAGNTTLIINACFAGFWVDCAVSLGLDSGRVTIITGGRKEVIHSHSLSGSEMYRGGYFMNNLVARLYREFGMHFPRPTILKDGLPICYETRFPDSNVDTVRLSNPARVSRSTLRSVVADICHDMQLLRGENSTPQVFSDGGRSDDALRFFGAANDNFSIKITHTSPSNPSQEFAGHGLTGCFGLKKNLPTAELARQYALLPFSPTAGPNTQLSMEILRWKNGKLSWVQERLLRRTLKRRLKAFESMEAELRRQGVKLGKWQHLEHEELLIWKSKANRFTVNEGGMHWTQVRDLFISSMIQHRASNPNA